MGRVVVVLLVLGCGAAPPAIPPLPSKGGPPWVEVSSEHFVVWTDAPAEQGEKLIREMEHLRQVVFGVAFGDVVSNVKTLVIAFRNIEEVHAFVPQQFIARAYSPHSAL